MQATAQKPGKPSLWLLQLTAGLLALQGAAMLLGGVWLVVLDGSTYYAIVGTALLASAVLLFRRKASGSYLYWLTLAGTITWSIWEVGPDGWALMPRVLVPALLGLWLTLPWIRRALMAGPEGGRTCRASALAGLVLSVALGVAAHRLAGPPESEDPLYQTGYGAFPSKILRVGYGALAEIGVPAADWPSFGGSQGGGHFSDLAAITPENVHRLKFAWSVDVGTVPGFYATPIKMGGTLYTCNNNNEVFALDAATGQQLWHFDASSGHGGSCRGVSYFTVPDSASSTGRLCNTRILTGTGAATLVALDAVTGKPCPDFGRKGIVNLLEGLGDVIPGYYRVTSAPTIVRGKVVVGGWVTDNQFWGEPSGVIRAFDAITGRLAWAWDMGRPDRTGAPPAGESYTRSTPNSWAPMSADEKLGLVYLPTGNATPDSFGALRRTFDEKYANSVVALDAETGRLRWSFQTVHHDLWDYDLPAQPSLVELPDRSGRMRKALVQATKQGEIYVLDRESGVPIFPVTEHRVPQTGFVPEERPSGSQPFSDHLPSFRGARLREEDMWGISPLDQLFCRIQFRSSRYSGIYTPPSLEPSIDYPSLIGAVNWGGVSIDPVHGVMVVNSLRLATHTHLISARKRDEQDLQPQGPWGSMGKSLHGQPQKGTPYGVTRVPWLTPFGIPCNMPPYGLLSAVDLTTGRLIWTQKFGTARGSGPLGFKLPLALPMGVPTYGGSMITRSGVLFIGTSKDGYFRAYDLRSGKELWRTSLPGGGSSTPVTYTINGRQYVVISAAGIHAMDSKLSTRMVAFALSE